MPDIDNYAVYTDRMRRSMWDKVFFMDKIPGAELVVDYGCADGSLIRFAHELFPSMRFIGFDIDAEMIARANSYNTENAVFCKSIADISAQIARWNIPPERTVVNFSSVLHEVFHYGYDGRIITDMLAAIKPRYITVRDMMYFSHEGDTAPHELVKRVRSALPQWQVADFEARWGSIDSLKNLVHLMLKFRYVENWQRECAENYFSYDQAQMLSLLGPDGAYRPVLYNKYFLPWCRFDAEQALGMELGDDFTTHYALVLARRSAEA